MRHPIHSYIVLNFKFYQAMKNNEGKFAGFVQSNKEEDLLEQVFILIKHGFKPFGVCIVNSNELLGRHSEKWRKIRYACNN